MASIQKRPNRSRPWRVMYRDPDDRDEDGNPKQKSKSFKLKRDADAFKITTEEALLRGTHVSLAGGKVPFREFVGEWLSIQTSDPSTREALASRVKNHMLPTFGGMELRAIRPSTVQAWLRGRQQECAPATVKVLLANLSSILSAAVADGLIAKNPCAEPSVRAPSVPDRRIVPWTLEQVEAVVAAHPERHRAVPLPAAGCGLRQGEVFGLDLDTVDFLRRKILVRQQVKIVGGRNVLAPPKGGKTREVPMPDVVAVALSEHLRRYPAREVTLPWREPGGEDRTVALIFTSRESGALNRNYYNTHVWKPSLERAGIEPSRANGMHALRHHYASVLLDGGISIRALATYLGHADPGFTLRTYTHLMPDNEDRTRAVVDAAYGPGVARELPKGAQDAR